MQHSTGQSRRGQTAIELEELQLTPEQVEAVERELTIALTGTAAKRAAAGAESGRRGR